MEPIPDQLRPPPRRWAPRVSLKLMLLAVLVVACLLAKKRHDDWHRQYVTIERLVSQFNREVAPGSQGVIKPLTVEEVKSAIRRKTGFGSSNTAIPLQKIVMRDWDNFLSSLDVLIRPSEFVTFWECGPFEDFWQQTQGFPESSYADYEANSSTPLAGTIQITLHFRAEFVWEGKGYPVEGAVTVRTISPVRRPPWR
ncbi:MAG: hypothetical protein U0795_01475 [Pirellulales bacterium]